MPRSGSAVPTPWPRRTLPISGLRIRKGALPRIILAPGTYYLWARRGDMLAYPPQKIELVEKVMSPSSFVSTTRRTRDGQVIPRPGYHVWHPDARP